MKKFIKKHISVFICLMAILSTLVLYVNLNIVTSNASNRIARFFEKANKSLNRYNISTIASFICFFAFYKKYYFKSKFKKSACILSVFTSIYLVLGYSYYKTNTWNIFFISKFQFFKSLIVITGYYFIFYILIKLLYEYLDTLGQKDKNKIKNDNVNNKKLKKIYNTIFEKHAFILPLLIILVSWLPYLVAFYPGVTTGGDTGSQLYMYYGIENKVSNAVILRDENVYITNHHPVIHTLLTAACMEIGINVFNSYYIGMFIYTIIQTIVMILVLSYTFVLFKKIETPGWIRIVALLLYCVISYFPLFAITSGKDTYFSITVLALIIYIFNFAKNNEIINNKKYCILLMLITLLTMLLRNDGIYRSILTFAIIIFLNKKFWKKLLFILAVPTCVYLVYLHVLLPFFKISNGSPAEMLSVPFQQTARVVYVHGYNAYDKKDIEIIKRVLPQYDNFKENYNPTLSDPIKNYYNKYATTNDLKNYFKVWFKYLFKYPTDYVQATLNNTYGYFYPDRVHNIGYTEIKGLNDGIFNIKSTNDGARSTIYNFHHFINKLPIIGLFYSVGFYNLALLVLIGYLLNKKHLKYVIVLIPLLMVLLVNLVSPVNGHWRYTFPIILSFPLIIGIIYFIAQSKDDKVKKLRKVD